MVSALKEIDPNTYLGYSQQLLRILINAHVI